MITFLVIYFISAIINILLIRLFNQFKQIEIWESMRTYNDDDDREFFSGSIVPVINFVFLFCSLLTLFGIMFLIESLFKPSVRKKLLNRK